VSTPGQQASFLDAANTLLARVPVRMETGTIDIPGAGRLGIVTFRSATTTMSPILTAAELDDWAGVLTDLAAAVRSAVLVQPTAAETVMLQQGNGRPPPV
jgi:hypothetical protein